MCGPPSWVGSSTMGLVCSQPLGTALTRAIQFWAIKNKQTNNSKETQPCSAISLLKEQADPPCAQQRAQWGCAAWKRGPVLPSGYPTIVQVLQDSPRWEGVGDFYHLFLALSGMDMAEFRPLGCCLQAVTHSKLLCASEKSVYYNHLSHSSHPKGSS